jgi:hypothetical protein
MSNELQYYGDPAVDAGLTVVARVYDSSGVQVGSDVATTEVGALAIYRGDMPVAIDGEYGVRFFSGTLLLGQETISWDGTAERTILGNATPTNVSDAQTAIQADIAALNNISTAQVADAVWDEVIDNANHNGAKSAGKRLRQAGTSLSIEGLVDDVSPTNTSFITDLAQATSSFYEDQTCIFVSGVLEGQARIVTSYDSGTKTLSFDEAWTLAPSDTDEFEIKADHVHPVSQIQNGLATSTEVLANETKIDLIETKAQADARQALLIAEHDATQSTLDGLNDFNPAVDVVANVTLVDTTTTNTDMRGTDGANTIPPDNASIAGVLINTNELQGNQGDWATATGFATPTNVTDAQTAIIAQVDANETKIDTITANQAIINTGVKKSSLLIPHGTDL